MSTSNPRFPQAEVDLRLSASLIIVNSRNEILLVRRNHNATAFAGMHVFPGGNFDQKQDMSLEMTAIRETFEESGLLLASSISGSLASPNDDFSFDRARRAIHQQKLDFKAFLKTKGLRANVDSLFPFSQWVTPVGSPRRFKTQFYIAFLPAVALSDFPSGSKQDYLPTDDNGQEIIETSFIHPRKALYECREGKLCCMPPQFYIISTLATILDTTINTPDQQRKVESLSAGAFGKTIFNPLVTGRDEDGRLIMSLEGDETRGSTKGRFHRIIVKVVTGLPIGFALVRNFDILENQDLLNASPTKL